MGLAPYGNPNSEQTSYFKNQILKHLIQLKDKLYMGMELFDHPQLFNIIRDKSDQLNDI